MLAEAERDAQAKLVETHRLPQPIDGCAPRALGLVRSVRILPSLSENVEDSDILSESVLRPQPRRGLGRCFVEGSILLEDPAIVRLLDGFGQCMAFPHHHEPWAVKTPAAECINRELKRHSRSKHLLACYARGDSGSTSTDCIQLRDDGPLAAADARFRNAISKVLGDAAETRVGQCAATRVGALKATHARRGALH
jgi:hypothetical protein